MFLVGETKITAVHGGLVVYRPPLASELGCSNEFRIGGANLFTKIAIHGLMSTMGGWLHPF
jgi:hypothetical protein